jgi:zinc protease
MPPKSIVYMMDKPGAQQSIIMVGNIAPPQNNPNEIAIEAMNDGLGGLFLSRINSNLRENKHWSYGTTSLLWGARGQRPWLTLAPVQTDKTKESLEEINKELRAIIGDHPLTQEELSFVQDNETLSLPGSRETQQEVGNLINELVQFGLPDDYYETYAGKVRALKAPDVEAAAKIIVHPDNLIWVVVGDRSKIEAGVKELNLGELRFLGPDGKPL